MIDKLTDRFIPPEARATRTDRELARTFVFTHLFGPLIAQPLWVYLYLISPDPGLPLAVLATAICGFWALPFALRLGRNMWLVSLLSFQGLAMTSLWGAYHYGGFNSPFMPWLVVSLMLGLFYLSKNARLVLALFAADVAVFLALIWRLPPPAIVPVEDLSVLGWLSISSATLYMTWMALYYAVVVKLRSEFETEAERSRAISIELERARAVAEATGRARARFFAKMSHELRTPLNAIIGYSEILIEDLEDDPDADPMRARDVGRISAAGKHLLSLVSSVLDADAIEHDGARVEVSPLTLGELADEVVANALPMVERGGNRLVVACEQRDAELVTDAKKLRQILINILGNAGKFTSKGVVELQLEVYDCLGEPQLRAVVADTGIGIEAGALGRLFTEYEQADAGVGARFGGTGIGLALSRRFCILLGGEISVTSAVGQGSCFTVTLPARFVPDEPTPERPPAIASSGGPSLTPA